MYGFINGTYIYHYHVTTEYWYYTEKVAVLAEYNRKEVYYNGNGKRVEDFHSKYVQ